MATDTAQPHEALERSPTAARSVDARAVAQDLEAIFGVAPHDARPAPAAPRQRRAPEEAPRGSRLASAGAFATAAFLGIAAAGFLMTRGSERPAASPPRPPLRVEVASAAPAAPAPGPIDPLPSVAATQAEAATPAPMQARPERALTRSPRAAPHAGPAPDAYAQITAADRRLREAYAAAIRAGTPRRALVSYRDRWEAMRRARAHDPRRLAAGYGALAAEIERAAWRARRDNQDLAARTSWRPRYAPWWS